MNALIALALLARTAGAMTLDEAIVATEAYAPGWTAAEARLAGTLAATRQSRARLGPVLAATGHYTLNQYAVAFDTADGTIVVQPLHYGDATASLEQGLSPTAIAAQRAADAELTAARSRHDQDLRLVRRAVVAAYYGLLLAQEAERVQAELLAVARSQEEVAASRLRAGLGDDRSTLQAQLAVSRAARELAAARATTADASLALSQLTGQAQPGELLWPERPAVPEARPRPDLQAATDRVEAARRRVRGSWTQWAPDLKLGVYYSWTGNAGFIGRNTLLSGVLTGTWVLAEPGARVHQRQQWLAELQEAEAALRQVNDQAGAEATSARNELARAEAAAQAMAAEERLAQRHHALTAQAFALGTATALEVDQAQVELRAATLGVLRERASVDLATWALLWALGG